MDRLRITALAGNALTSNDTVRLGVPTGRRSGRVLVGTVTGIDVVRAVRRGRALGPQLGTRYEPLVLAGRSERLTDESARKPRQARTLSGQRGIRRRRGGRGGLLKRPIAESVPEQVVERAATRRTRVTGERSSTLLVSTDSSIVPQVSTRTLVQQSVRITRHRRSVQERHVGHRLFDPQTRRFRPRLGRLDRRRIGRQVRPRLRRHGLHATALTREDLVGRRAVVSVPRDGDAHGPVDTHSGRVVPARIDLGQDDVSVLTVTGTVMMQAKLFADSVDRPSVLDREVARK